MSNKIDWQDFLDKMRSTMCDTMMIAFGVTPTYQPESLNEVEQKINEMYPEGHKAMPTTYLPFGFYLGETIVRNIPGAKWDISEAGEFFDNIAITIDQSDEAKAKLFPFRRVMKFWDDRTDGLSVFYRMINLMALGGINPEAVQKGQWLHFPNGDAFRMTEGPKEDEDGERTFGSGHPYN